MREFCSSAHRQNRHAMEQPARRWKTRHRLRLHRHQPLLSHGLRRDTQSTLYSTTPTRRCTCTSTEKPSTTCAQTKPLADHLQKNVQRQTAPGISTSKTGFEPFSNKKRKITPFMCWKRRKKRRNPPVPENPLFILGDHVGLPKTRNASPALRRKNQPRKTAVSGSFMHYRAELLLDRQTAQPAIDP